jgi:hypothetical protein
MCMTLIYLFFVLIKVHHYYMQIFGFYGKYMFGFAIVNQVFVNFHSCVSFGFVLMWILISSILALEFLALVRWEIGLWKFYLPGVKLFKELQFLQILIPIHLFLANSLAVLSHFHIGSSWISFSKLQTYTILRNLHHLIILFLNSSSPRKNIRFLFSMHWFNFVATSNKTQWIFM